MFDADLPEISAEELREAAKAPSTHATYLTAIRHYRDTWGGLLPASPDSISRYIAKYAGKVSVSTSRVRLSALSKWHSSQGFHDPTKAPEVKEVMKGLAKIYNAPQKSAPPFTFDHLRAVCDRLEEDKIKAIRMEDRPKLLQVHRDLALFLTAFWQGLRSDEVSRIRIEETVVLPDEELRFFLPHFKNDVHSNGREFVLPAMQLYCPVNAVQGWLDVSGLLEGPLFRKVDRWGGISESGINKRSIEGILNRAVEGLFENKVKFTTHSFRKGFADWASKNDWDIKGLMDHVGWGSEQSALRYLPGKKNYGSLLLDRPSVLKRVVKEVEDNGRSVATTPPNRRQLFGT